MESVFLYNKMLLSSNPHVLRVTLLSHALKDVRRRPSPPSETTASQLNASHPEAARPLRLCCGPHTPTAYLFVVG